MGLLTAAADNMALAEKVIESNMAFVAKETASRTLEEPSLRHLLDSGSNCGISLEQTMASLDTMDAAVEASPAITMASCAFL